MASKLVGVKYIGGKAKKVDNVASTGAEWVPGQVINFNIEIANKLLVHKTVWELCDVDPNGDTYIGNKKATGPVIDPVPFVNLHEMDINALAAFAKVEFNQAVDISLPIESARNLVHGFMSNRTADDLASLNKPAPKNTIGIEVNDAEYEAYIAGELVLKLVPASYIGPNTPDSAENQAKAGNDDTVKVADSTTGKSDDDESTIDAQALTITAQDPSIAPTESAPVDTKPADPIAELQANLELLDAKQLREMCKQSGIAYANTMTAEKLREKLLAVAIESAKGN